MHLCIVFARALLSDRCCVSPVTSRGSFIGQGPRVGYTLLVIAVGTPVYPPTSAMALYLFEIFALN